MRFFTDRSCISSLQDNLLQNKKKTSKLSLRNSIYELERKDNNALILHHDKTLSCIDISTQKELWFTTLPTPKSGKNLYVMSTLPIRETSYKKQYILINKARPELYFIDAHLKPVEVQINQFEVLLNGLKEMGNLDVRQKFYLTPDQINRFITLNGGHNPPCFDSYLKKKIKLFANGYVLHMSEEEVDSSSLNNVYNINVLHNGQMITNFLIDKKGFEIRSLHMVNERIFGVAHNKGENSFYEWDMNGDVVRHMSIGSIGGGKMQSNDHYYTLSAHWGRNGEVPGVFIFNIETNESTFFNHKDKDLSIKSVALHNNKLICGTHFSRETPEYSFAVDRDPQIRIYDIITGQMESKYDLPNQSGSIIHLKANDKFIVFLQYEGATDKFYSINRENGELKTIHEIPYCLDNNIDWGGQLTVSLEENNFSVCSAIGHWNPIGDYTGSYWKLFVKDLETDKTLTPANVQYNRYPWRAASFESGILIIPTSIESSSLYIEDFNNVTLDETCEASSSMTSKAF